VQYVFFIAAGVYTLGNTLFIIFGTTKEQKWNREEYLLLVNVPFPFPTILKRQCNEIFDPRFLTSIDFT
jgi:hypothetical protein